MSKEIIKSAYEMIDKLTPLKSDCGRICESACCVSEGYMVLFPGESQLLGEGFDISPKVLKGYGAVATARCSGMCDRSRRPLSCRIFPLAPKIVDGEVFVRMDPRARNVCPLSHKSILSLDREFTNTIKKMFSIMFEDSDLAPFIKALSDISDEYAEILK